METKEKTTALDSSAPTDEKRLPFPIDAQSIASGAGKHKCESLKTIDGQSLLSANLPPIQFIVEDLLPQGLFILAGSPKVGKSWLSLMLCQKVAVGGQLWGRNIEQGTVLYLALEDSLARLQTRYRKYSVDGTAALHFATRSRTLRDGLTAQVNHFICGRPDTRLVVVDTMQHIRGNATDKNLYVNDYNDMNILREITNRYDIALLLVTHTRKMEDADPLNRISGSTGLVGAVDGVLILEKEARSSNKGQLTVANRDTDGHVFNLQFDTISCLWELLEEEIAEYREEPLFPFLIALLADTPNWQGTATELCDAAKGYAIGSEYSPVGIAKRLRTNDQLLFNKYRIEVKYRMVNNQKLIYLSKTNTDLR